MLLGLCYLPEGCVPGAVLLQCVGAMSLAFIYMSWIANPVDLAPAYTGFIVGVCEVGACWVSIAVPIFFDAVTTNVSI